jgi:hypothetical protein
MKKLDIPYLIITFGVSLYFVIGFSSTGLIKVSNTPINIFIMTAITCFSVNVAKWENMFSEEGETTMDLIRMVKMDIILKLKVLQHKIYIF